MLGGEGGQLWEVARKSLVNSDSGGLQIHVLAFSTDKNFQNLVILLFLVPEYGTSGDFPYT